MTVPWTLSGRTLARALAAAAALALFAGSSPAPRVRGPAPARIAGKLGLPAALHLEAAAEDGAVRLDLIVRPGADLPAARLEFVLPEGWSVVSGTPSERVDLTAGREVSRTLRAWRAPGAPPMAAARVRCGALGREVYGAVEPWAGAPFPGALLDRDDAGREVRVFRLGEGR